ncbi:MAG: hypothetical protein JO290_01165 [Sphingomonadaceae bacterium]|nr:hypothetical protein [Sphingomonadaceae bacterium]
MALTTYAANAILNHLDGSAAFAKPTVFVGLLASNPTVAGTQTSELAYAGYARLATTAATWTAAAVGAANSAQQLTFGTKTDAGSVTASYWATFDAATGGNMIEFGALGTPKTINQNDAPFIPAGSFTRTAS